MSSKMKEALVLKRLAMLQSDHDDLHTHALVPVQTPNPHESRSTGAKMENNGAKVSANKDSIQNNSGRTDHARSLNDKIVSCQTPLKTYVRSLHNRKRKMIDDKSEPDEKLHALTQPAKKATISTKKRLSRCNTSVKRRKFSNIKIVGHSDDSPDELSSVMKRAEEIQANVSASICGWRIMLPSHVAGGFWLGLPGKICAEFLSKCSDAVELVDEAGTSFKVYIVRKHCPDELDGAMGLLTLEACAQPPTLEACAQPPITAVTEDADRSERVSPLRNSESPRSSAVDLGSELLDGNPSPDSAVNSEAVTGWDNFQIVANDRELDFLFSDINKKKYYELCCSQKTMLHKQLNKCLTSDYALSGIILETINIADAIRACSASTSTENLMTWQKTLEGFEQLGMKVDFLQAKLRQLLDVDSEFDKADESNRIAKFIYEQTCVKEKMRALENQIIEEQETLEKIDQRMKAEITASERYEAQILEIANSSW